MKILYLTGKDRILTRKTANVTLLKRDVASVYIPLHVELGSSFCFFTLLRRLVDGLIGLDEDVAPALCYQNLRRLPRLEGAAGRHQIQVGRHSLKRALHG